MTVTSVEEMWSRQSTTDRSSDGRSFVRTYRSAYQVEHTHDTSLDAIRTAAGIPRVRDLFPGYSNVFCTSVGEVKHGLTLSIVPVTYEGEVSSGGSDATFQPPEIEYGSMETTEEADRDGYGQALTNTAGDPVQGLQGTLNDMFLSVRRNYLSINGPLASQYLNSTNSDSMVVFGDVWQPGQAHLKSYSAKPVFDGDGNISYFAVSARVDFRHPVNTVAARAWWYRYRNEGKRARYATTVAFTGGGGSRASGYAVASSGAVTKVVITNRGTGYTSAPTVTFTSTTGGTSAAGTAVLGTGAFSGEVVSVTVTNGGSGYKSGIEPVLDRNKEPVTEPVLLKADGTIETDADTAFFCERPRFPFSLPYNSLGLLD